MTSSTLSFPPPLGCADVDARLADYLDDEPPTALAASERAAVDRHVAACTRCRTLVDELRAVSDAAASLPTREPPRDLWPAIAARLEPRAAPRAPDADDGARVLPFEVRHLRHAPRPAHERRGGAHVTWPRRWLAAAAVALVCVSAGSTYLLTRAGTVADGDASGAPGVTRVAAADAPAPRAPADIPALAPEPAPAAELDAPEPPDAGGTRAPTVRPRNAGPAPRFVARRAPADDAIDALVPAAVAYDREITALRAVVRERRGELDSATVAVLARNLRIIDAAVAESRAALARDPHSQFLGDQLTRALGQQVELLRTVALLPRT